MIARYDAGAPPRGEADATRREPLREAVLAQFPERAHPLTLVHDPDGLLADERVLVTLADRGFRIVFESGPIALRYQVEACRPWTPERPLIVRTEGRLIDLPFDLWQPSHRVELGLHAFFSRLDYPTVRQLGPVARARLSAVPLPAQMLGPLSTAAYLLRHAYDADISVLREPATLLVWLADYHATREPMPEALAARLADSLSGEAVFANWDLPALLTRREALQSFLATEWSGYLATPSPTPLGETLATYVIDFAHDVAVQDAVPRLVRSGALAPIDVGEWGTLPPWARPAIRAHGADDWLERFDALASALGEALRSDLRSTSWPAWVGVAKNWAALETIHDSPPLFHSEDQRSTFRQLQHAIDTQFAAWLPSHYGALGTLALPTPHHLFHVPGYIAFDWRTRPVDRIALLVVDGMALRDWILIGPIWKRRHPDWSMREDALLAQVPTTTSVSRQALVSGSRPAHFAASLTTNRFESKQWATFWARQDPPLLESACPYVRIGASESAVAFGSRQRAVCLIAPGIDDIVHGATFGNAAVQASLNAWLDRDALALEREIASLLAQNFRVYIASDHGHVEAVGVGVPSEGVVIESRGKRARVYRDRAVAERAHARFPDTFLWEDDGLLPNDALVLIPSGRTAFATVGELVVTHGGTTLDEMIVPFVTIESQEWGNGEQGY
jgi:hypothetical protein